MSDFKKRGVKKWVAICENNQGQNPKEVLVEIIPFSDPPIRIKTPYAMIMPQVLSQLVH